jgi:hypothetical protein
VTRCLAQNQGGDRADSQWGEYDECFESSGVRRTEHATTGMIRTELNSGVVVLPGGKL